MNPLYVALAMLGGSVMPIQAGFNRELGRHFGSPMLATLNNFAGGTLIMLVACLALAPTPTLAAAASAPWWAWLGGACGVTLVFSSTVAVKHVGSAGLVASLLAGQLICSLVIDQFGLLGHEVRAMTLPRLLGVALLVGGLVLIQRG